MRLGALVYDRNGYPSGSATDRRSHVVLSETFRDRVSTATSQLSSPMIFRFLRSHPPVDEHGCYSCYSGEGRYWDEIFAESPTRFRFRGQDVVLAFVPETDGQVNRIDIEYQGLQFTATRIE